MNNEDVRRSDGFCLILTAVDTEERAKSLAKLIIETKLAACVSVLPQAVSFYFWEDKLQEASEYLLLLKTHQDKMEELMMFLKTSHPYALPEMIQLPILSGSAAYLDRLSSCLG